jgi:hypothetical protein
VEGFISGITRVNVRDKVLHLCKSTHKIIILYIVTLLGSGQKHKDSGMKVAGVS